MARKKILDYCEDCGGRKDFSSRRKCKKCHVAIKKRENQRLLLAIRLGDQWNELITKKEKNKMNILNKVKDIPKKISLSFLQKFNLSWGKWLCWLVMAVLLLIMK